MSLFAPKYYKDFHCIADRCTHSCCVGWEIDIDSNSLKKYSALSGNYATEIKSSIEGGDPPHFRLGTGDRCPHLDECGLCRIITELGEGYLTDICREHPRFNISTMGAGYVGVGMACEEACRIILSSDEYHSFIPVGEYDGEGDVGFDAAPYINEAYAILLDKSLFYPQRLSALAEGFCAGFSDIPDGEWHSLIGELEYLTEKDRERFLAYLGDAEVKTEFEAPLTRALAYFIFRHALGAESYEEFRAGVGLALFCERLIASLAAKDADCDFKKLCDIARTVSEEIEYSEDNTEAIKFTFI